MRHMTLHIQNVTIHIYYKAFMHVTELLSANLSAHHAVHIGDPVNTNLNVQHTQNNDSVCEKDSVTYFGNYF
jgi:hypothetical protein